MERSDEFQPAVYPDADSSSCSLGEMHSSLSGSCSYEYEVCYLPSDDQFSLSCECCDKWFHGSCVGVTIEEASELGANLSHYSCWHCSAKPTAELYLCPIFGQQFDHTRPHTLWYHISRTHTTRSQLSSAAFIDHHDRLICSSLSCHWVCHKRFSRSGCRKISTTDGTSCGCPLVSPHVAGLASPFI